MVTNVDDLQLIRPGELAKLLKVSRTSLWSWRKSGAFPQPLRIGSCIGWPVASVAKFLAQKQAIADAQR